MMSFPDNETEAISEYRLSDGGGFTSPLFARGLCAVFNKYLWLKIFLNYPTLTSVSPQVIFNVPSRTKSEEIRSDITYVYKFKFLTIFLSLKYHRLSILVWLDVS